jgi:hypothetical protein
VVGALITRVLYPQHDWVAFGAIATALGAAATFAAVVVALLPIWERSRRERDQALNVRLRLITHLLGLGMVYGPRTSPGYTEAPGTFVQETDEATEAISALLPQLVLLDAEEFILVLTVHTDLVLLRRVGSVPLQEARDSLAHVKQALAALRARLNPRRQVPLP